MRRLLLGFLAALLVAPVAAQTAEERVRLDQIAERGRLLFELDRAAWIATDDFLARMPDAAQQGIGGYVVEPSGDGFAVTFYVEEADRLVGVYTGTVADGELVSGELLSQEARPLLTGPQARLAGARSVPSRLDFRSCTGPFNVTTVPPTSAAAPLEVYLLSPQAAAAEYPMGGHFLVTLSPEGEVVSSRKFTNSCLNISVSREPVGLFVTHLLDPIPTEMHVFASLALEKPIYVATREANRVWKVSGSEISLLDSAPNAAGR